MMSHLEEPIVHQTDLFVVAHHECSADLSTSCLVCVDFKLDGYKLIGNKLMS